MTDPQNDFFPARKSPLERVKDWEDQESWGEFYDKYWRFIYSVALKSGLTEAEADEVLQETVITASDGIRQFRDHPGAGSFKGWLLEQTRRQIDNQLRKRRRGTRRRGGKPGKRRQIGRVADPAGGTAEELWDAEWKANLLAAATERVKGKISPKQFQVYQLYVQEEWPASKVATALGVSAAQVHSAKRRVSALLKKEVRHLSKGPGWR